MILGDDAERWKHRIINVAGNHDLPINRTWDIADATDEAEEKFPIPEIRIIVLNDMNLDTPASSKELQTETYQFLNQAITHSRDGFTEGIFGMNADTSVPGQGLGRGGLILTGHDHEGCDTYHYINQTAPPQQEWEAMRWKDAVAARIDEQPGIPGLREITVRSMMGSYAGNAGLLSLWFDEETWDWKFEFTTCGLGTQHICTREASAHHGTDQHGQEKIDDIGYHEPDWID
ncbi:putative protein TED1 [Glarea lozoyensis 74030]|uniref:Uncharacterized protein n=1 Tax=Glarea lozoyensis (strain ATCC 74030 / MF5533) TaxID=1104152 RepID=H0EGR6_GLAL7|nr:putative protein TED1 [Glarea lozoyensis 74030]